MFLHAALHYGLAAVFVAVGAVFLVLAVTAYRSPSDVASGRAASG